MAERRLIVNADDLGRSVGINDGIFEAHQRGIVTSATLMVGQPAARDAAERLRRHPDLGVGLHATLTGAPPTLPADRVPSLVDSEGELPRRPEGAPGQRFAQARPDEVLAEVEHQLRLFRDLTERDPTHLDAHHHSHRQPVVLEALLTVARRLEIPVRRSSNAIAARLEEVGVATTDHFDETFYGADATEEALARILAELPSGTTELMCHPGYSDSVLRRESAYADAREVELRLLTAPGLRASLARQQIELIAFPGLAA